jgi:hypothetical protein
MADAFQVWLRYRATLESAERADPVPCYLMPEKWIRP